MTRSFFAAVIGSISIVLGSAPSSAQNAYITNSADGTVSVIDTATNTVLGSPIPVGASPGGVAVTLDGSKVYVGNGGDNTVSVIDTATNTVSSTIPVGSVPSGVAVNPDGSKVYVTSVINGTTGPFCGPEGAGPPCFQSVILEIDAATDTVVDTIPLPVFDAPLYYEHGGIIGIAVSPDGSEVYVSYATYTQYGFDRGGVLVISTETSSVVGSISINIGGGPGGLFPGVAVSPDGGKVYVPVRGGDSVAGVSGFGVEVVVIDTATDTQTGAIGITSNGTGDAGGLAITPDGSKVYVTVDYYPGTSTVSAIDTATNAVVGTIAVGAGASGIAITPDGTKAYVVNGGDTTVSVINTATNTVVAVLPVGNAPIASGVFIQPRFAGTIGATDCHDNSTSALAQTFGGLKPAAIALGFPTVQALQTAVGAYCGA